MSADVDPSHLHGRDIRERAFDFACRLVVFAKALRSEGGVGALLVPQIVSSGTSVPAMLEEARGAESRRDFVSKTSIALKEAREVWVRLRICARTRCGPLQEGAWLVSEADQIVAILATIVDNTRNR
jgi:four helix bundle protein